MQEYSHKKAKQLNRYEDKYVIGFEWSRCFREIHIPPIIIAKNYMALSPVIISGIIEQRGSKSCDNHNPPVAVKRKTDRIRDEASTSS